MLYLIVPVTTVTVTLIELSKETPSQVLRFLFCLGQAPQLQEQGLHVRKFDKVPGSLALRRSVLSGRFRVEVLGGFGGLKFRA